MSQHENLNGVCTAGDTNIQADNIAIGGDIHVHREETHKCLSVNLILNPETIGSSYTKTLSLSGAEGEQLQIIITSKSRGKISSWLERIL